MPVQTCSQTQQKMQTLSSTSENMAKETDNIHGTVEAKQLIEKSLACQRTKFFSQFSEILL